MSTISAEILKYTVIALMLALCNQLNAIELKKEVKRNYKSEEIQKLTIVNESGRITIESWKKNSIEISVTIRVKSSNSGRARQEIDEYNVVFDTIDNDLNIYTKIPEISISFWRRLFGQNDDVSFDFRYKIKCPPSTAFNINNANGDIILDILDSQSQFDLFKGNIKAKKLTGSCEFRLNNASLETESLDSVTLHANYSTLKIGRLMTGKFNLNYSQFSANELNNTIIESRTGIIELTTCNTCTFISNFDRINITSSSNLLLNGKRSEIKVLNAGNMDIDGEHLKIDLAELNNRNTSVNIKGKYNHISIRARNPYRFELETKNLMPDIRSTDITLSIQRLKSGNWTESHGFLQKEATDSNVFIKQEFGSLRLE